MPILSRFHGISIYMYFFASEHNPPHIHAICAGDMAIIRIDDGKIIEGSLPRKTLSLIRRWMTIHRCELLQMWETQEFKPIDPLS